MTDIKTNGAHALEDVVNTAKTGAESAYGNVRSAVLSGVQLAASVASMMRSFGVDDALGWVGLARRRGPMPTILSFGAGFALGAGAGILFAPKSGAETRQALRDRIADLEKGMMHLRKRIETGVSGVEQKIEEKVEEGAKKIERKLEGKNHHASRVS